MQNTLRFTAEKRAETINAVLYDIIKALNATEDIGGLVTSIYDSLAGIIDTTTIFIALYDAPKDRITFPYYRDIDNIEVIDNASKTSSLTARVILSEAPLFLCRKELEALYARLTQESIGAIARVWLGVPLKIKGTVIGALAVQSYTDPDCYTEADIPLLESVSGTIAIALDRRRKEEALKESERRYRELFERTSDFVFVHDLSGRLLESNAEFKQPAYPALSPGDLTFEKVTDLLSRGNKPEFSAYMERILANEKDAGLLAATVGDTGCELIIAYDNRLIRDSDGTPLCVQGSARDVTEVIRQKKRKKEMERHLVQSQKMEAIGTLASGIAHDFNNILFYILGYAQLGAEQAKSEKTRVFFENINRGSDRARELIQRLLNISRPSETAFRSVAIGQNVKEALKFIRASLPATIGIRLTADPDIGCVCGDPTQVHQVILNLMTNAYQAMEEGKGTIEVTLSGVSLPPFAPETGCLAPGRYVALTVKDDGCGMDGKTLGRIFDPFYTTKAVGEGTGLGLSTVHSIVRGHQGHIQAKSRPGEGSVFSVWLPEVVESVPAPRASKKNAAGGKERILVVDDEAILAELYQEILEDAGYRTGVFTSSASALSRYSEDPGYFDLVLSDLTMPEMTGVELALAIGKTGAQTPVIIATGLHDAISPAERKASSIQTILHKPVDRQKLLGTIREALDRR